MRALLAKRDRVGRKPAGGRHGVYDIGFAADQSDIDRIARVAITRLRKTRGLGEERMTAEVTNPELRHDQIGRHRP